MRTDKGYIEKIKEFIPHYTKGKRIGKSEPVIENYLLMGRKQCEIIESIDYSIPPCYPSDEELEKIKKHIVKHSPNIIDLIEVGDYVNGSYVVDILEDMQTGELHLEMTYNYTNEEKGDCTIYNKDIKTIVTREMMRSVEYRLE